MTRDSYFSGAFPKGYLGRYWPGVATAPAPETGAGYTWETLIGDRRLHTGAGQSRAQARTLARAERLSPPPPAARFSARGRAQLISIGDEEACLSACLLN